MTEALPTEDNEKLHAFMKLWCQAWEKVLNHTSQYINPESKIFFLPILCNSCFITTLHTYHPIYAKSPEYVATATVPTLTSFSIDLVNGSAKLSV